jgi:hypothetical protein
MLAIGFFTTCLLSPIPEIDEIVLQDEVQGFSNENTRFHSFFMSTTAQPYASACQAPCRAGDQSGAIVELWAHDFNPFDAIQIVNCKDYH